MMTLGQLSVRSFTTCLLSYCALALYFTEAFGYNQGLKWVIDGLTAMIGCFLSIRFVKKRNGEKEDGNAQIGDSQFEKFGVAGISWLPVILCLFGIISTWMNVEIDRIGWVLVALGGDSGVSAANLPYWANKS